MNILHINSYYSTTQLYTELYNRQVKQGHHIEVYVPVSEGCSKNKLPVNKQYSTVVETHGKYDRVIFQIKHQKILNDLKTRYDVSQFDIVHAHSLFSNGWLAYQLNCHYKIPYIVAVRGTDLRTFFKKMPWMKKIGLEILKHAHHIIFISNNAKNEVFEHYIPQHLKDELLNKTSVIANGISNFWHENAFENKPAHTHQPIRIVVTGKIILLKRILQLAQMVERYNKGIHPAELHIIGAATNKHIVKQLERFNNIYYYGQQNQETIVKLYREMDIFALLSSPETFGLVYVEAMSQGLPVIYSKGEGFDSFFEDHTVGVSVEKSDYIGFSKAIDYIMKHYAQLSQNALTGSQFFEWDAITKRYIDLYHDVVNSQE